MIPMIIAGASYRGEYLGQLLTETGEVELTACVDPITTRADYLIEKNGWTGCRTFADISEALAAVPSEAVIVASSDPYHAAVAIPALEAGKFVYCEKPLDTTLEKCRNLAAADRAVGGKTFVGLNLRFAPTYARIKQLIDDGAIGRVLTIQADEFYMNGRTYFRRWNRKPENGGLWLSKCTHDFDIILWMAGAKPLEVYAAGRRSYYAPRPDAAQYCRDCALRPDCPDAAGEPDGLVKLTEEATGQPYDLCLFNSDGDTFDHGMATIRHENEIYSTLTCNVVAGFTNRRLRVSGTKGTIDGALDGATTVTLYRRDPSEVEEIPLESGEGSHGGADGQLPREFIRFIRGEGEPRCRPDEAAQSVRLGLAATRACAEHRAVPMSEFPW
ncbi:MAG: Gfo/Idh/MocA family protein [Armatimonadota bacterium]